jgi:hypothetical protein
MFVATNERAGYRPGIDTLDCADSAASSFLISAATSDSYKQGASGLTDPRTLDLWPVSTTDRVVRLDQGGSHPYTGSCRPSLSDDVDGIGSQAAFFPAKMRLHLMPAAIQARRFTRQKVACMLLRTNPGRPRLEKQ